ncbi:MFS general substrate transporter [Cantharellus anzutake]|uniref:MFS general substrate transporter n=1 Tax=Cantharellus anzutake TaxID=1750568 RepID=UPI001904B312|nr:MFS general substrate transporter [Cantharellus anzutake]KAF8334174.1 MFS general substrate transporter [Cantharellus anzutake]
MDKPKIADVDSEDKRKLDFSDTSHLDSSSSDAAPLEGSIDLAAARRARTKIDLIVLTTSTIVLFLNFLDKTNIGNAAKAGLLKDLHMSSYRLSVVLSLFFIPYLLVELISNFLFKRIGAHIFIPGLVVAWGIVETSQGFVTSYHGLLICRLFLGLTEGPLVPALLLYLSELYKRHELQKRIAMLTFSGLLAYAIVHIDGKAGRPSWSWIFFLEGIFTVIFGVTSYFWLPEDIASATFMTEKEQSAYINAIQEDTALDRVDDAFQFSIVWSSLTTPHVVLLGTAGFFAGTLSLFSRTALLLCHKYPPGYLSNGLGYFIPTVVGSLGYSPTETQLYGVPPFACAFVLSMMAAYFSDKYRCRGLIALGASFTALAGYIVMYYSTNVHVRYGSIFAQTIGTSIISPCALTLIANNVYPHYRRATAIAFGIVNSSAGGILAMWMYHDAPRFHKTTKLNISCTIVFILHMCLILGYLYYKNLQKAKERGLYNNIPDDNVEEKRRLGDGHRDFIYTL